MLPQLPDAVDLNDQIQIQHLPPHCLNQAVGVARIEVARSAEDKHHVNVCVQRSGLSRLDQLDIILPRHMPLQSGHH